MGLYIHSIGPPLGPTACMRLEASEEGRSQASALPLDPASSSSILVLGMTRCAI
jgi:hypothetical protein